MIALFIGRSRCKADLLLVLGTSLKVAPVSRILQFMPPNVPQVGASTVHKYTVFIMLSKATLCDMMTIYSYFI